MTFESAKTKLKKIAKGKYHMIGYELNEYVTGMIKVECSLYIDKHKIHTGPTWDSAFASLLCEINDDCVDINEQPKGDKR